MIYPPSLTKGGKCSLPSPYKGEGERKHMRTFTAKAGLVIIGAMLLVLIIIVFFLPGVLPLTLLGVPLLVCIGLACLLVNGTVGLRKLRQSSRSGGYGLRNAVLNEEYERVHDLLAKGVSPDFRSGQIDELPGLTVLSVASMSHHVNIVELLLEKGANVNGRNRDGSTPLHVAVKNDRLDAARILIAWGAEVNTRDKDGKTPLALAGNRQLLDLLRQHRAME